MICNNRRRYPWKTRGNRSILGQGEPTATEAQPVADDQRVNPSKDHPRYQGGDHGLPEESRPHRHATPAPCRVALGRRLGADRQDGEERQPPDQEVDDEAVEPAHGYTRSRWTSTLCRLRSRRPTALRSTLRAASRSA